MARIRSVHPDICLSETMAGVSAELERTFVRLWTHCDDKGRCIDNARLLKAALFPLHDEMTAVDVDEHLRLLWRAGLLQRYSVEGNNYLQVCSWSEYQHPKHPTDSKYPEPTGEHIPPCGESLTPIPPESTQGVVVGEGVGEGGGEGVLAPVPARNGRPPDVVWNAMLEVCGINGEIPSSARGAYNKARSELNAVHATPETIRQRASIFRMRWPQVSLTPTALSRRWAECEANPAHLPARQVSAAEAFLLTDALENP